MNINPTPREYVYILLKRTIKSCSNRFSELMFIENNDDILIIKEFIKLIEKKEQSKSVVLSIKNIIEFRNGLEHNNNYLMENVNNKLDVLLLSYMNLNRVYKLDNFTVVIATFDFIFSIFDNKSFNEIRNFYITELFVNEVIERKSFYTK